MDDLDCPDCDYSGNLNGLTSHHSQAHDKELYKSKYLIDEIIRLYEKLGRSPYSKEMEEIGKFSKTAYNNQFGTWNNALIESGLDVNVNRKITEEDMKNEILRLNEKLGDVPTFSDMKKFGKYCPELYNKRMGTYRDAIKSCGLEPYSTPTGKDSPHWNGGQTNFYKTDAGLAWRKAVFQRDNYTCQDCGDGSGGNLNAHHIKRRKEFPEIELMVWNGVTLCVDCHAERHKNDKVYEMLKHKAKELSGSE